VRDFFFFFRYQYFWCGIPEELQINLVWPKQKNKLLIQIIRLDIIEKTTLISYIMISYIKLKKKKIVKRRQIETKPTKTSIETRPDETVLEYALQKNNHHRFVFIYMT